MKQGFKGALAVLVLGLVVAGCDPCDWWGGDWCPPPAEGEDGISCVDDSGCGYDACFEGFCRAACEADVDCRDGFFCYNSIQACIPMVNEECNENEHCLNGEICFNGQCLVPNPCDEQIDGSTRCAAGTSDMGELCSVDPAHPENGAQWWAYSCGVGNYCWNRGNGSGQCVAIGSQACSVDADCFEGGFCDAGECRVRNVCVPEPFEVCGDGVDNDCDGETEVRCLPCQQDSDCPLEYERFCSNDLRPFYVGYNGECGVNGLCRTTYDEINPQMEATPEICGDNRDNDCDGLVDEQCEAWLEGFLSANSPSGWIVSGTNQVVLRFVLMAAGADILLQQFKIRIVQPDGQGFLTSADLDVVRDDGSFIVVDPWNPQVVIEEGTAQSFEVLADVLPPPDVRNFVFYVEIYEIEAVNTYTAELVYLREGPKAVISGNFLQLQ